MTNKRAANHGDATTVGESSDAPKRRREGRGSNAANVNQFTNAPLRNCYELVSIANSESTKTNIRHAKKVIKKYAEAKGAPDPIRVTVNSSTFVLNLLADYCKFGTANSLKNDAMGALVQGLRHVYSENGHTTTWFVDPSNNTARGNPLVGNPELNALRRAHRVHLAHYGSVTLRARPIAAEHVCDIAERFWYGRGSEVLTEDILLHAILVVGLNLGLRYDEITKLRVENLSVHSGGCTMTLNESIKNSTVQRTYSLKDWEGNTALRYSYFLDPFLALYSWITVRGSLPGPIFCDIKETASGSMLDTSKAWSSKKFTDFLRKRLSAIGIGAGDVIMYSGHSIKRGSVQLYRSLGLRDEAIMERIQMSGQHAYANYCAAYNDCAPQSLPRFTSISDYISHAEKVSGESELIHNREDFETFMKEVWGNEDGTGEEPLKE